MAILLNLVKYKVSHTNPHLEKSNATGKIAAEIEFLSLIEDELLDAKGKRVEQDYAKTPRGNSNIFTATDLFSKFV